VNDNNVIYIDALKIVRDQNLSERVWNMFFLGYISYASGIIHYDSLEKSIVDLITKNVDENLSVLKNGYDYKM